MSLVRFQKYLIALFVGMAVIFIFFGCARIEPAVKTGLPLMVEKKPVPHSQELGWWQVRYRVQWDQENDPSWFIDLFLAHDVVYPLLEGFSGQLELWRFHRRASKDESGHQFSLLIYSSPETAQHLFDALQASVPLQKAQSAGVIIDASYDDTTETRKPAIEDTSDKGWSSTTQKTWPYYSMGISRMWLAMIEHTIKDNPPEEQLTSMDQIQAFYRQVDESIKQIWQAEGNHAFLHHLSALFGYEPFIIYERKALYF